MYIFQNSIHFEIESFSALKSIPNFLLYKTFSVLNSFRVEKFTVKGGKGTGSIVSKLFPESRKYFIEKRPGSISRRGKTDLSSG